MFSQKSFKPTKNKLWQKMGAEVLCAAAPNHIVKKKGISTKEKAKPKSIRKTKAHIMPNKHERQLPSKN